MYKKNKDFKWAMVKDNVLTKTECKHYINKIKNTKGVIKNREHVINNGRFVSFDNDPISKKIFNIVKIANSVCFKFSIGESGICYGKEYSEKEFIQIEDNDFHSDLSTEDNIVAHYSDDGKELYRDNEGTDRYLDVFDTTTKLTTILFLNDEFEGGNLQIWSTQIEPKPGRLVIFPSFAAHKIRKFSGGDRFVIATFIKGDYFK